VVPKRLPVWIGWINADPRSFQPNPVIPSRQTDLAFTDPEPPQYKSLPDGPWLDFNVLGELNFPFQDDETFDGLLQESPPKLKKQEDGISHFRSKT